MTRTPQQALKEQFGFDDFRQGQEAVISRLLGGQSVLAIFPTGAGKSLCYQLPALMLDGVTLVVSPLIALMKDQIDFLQSKGIRAARLDSSLDLTEYRQVMNDFTAGHLKLLYIAPERLASERFLQTLKRLNIAMLAVDEVHCVSEWGHNFRPDYMKLANLAQDLNIPRVLGLTATATPSVADDIAQAFHIEPENIIKTPFHRKNLTLHVTPVPEAGEGEAPREPRLREGEAPSEPSSLRTQDSALRTSLLLDRLRFRPPGPTIVYVTLQKTAEDLATFLAENGLPARPYHAGLDAEERHAIQDQFMQGDRAIVVATIAFGMGIDKKDIRYVYHYNLPKTLENYAQEIGRAGRDGLPSTCELLADPADQIPLQNFTFGDTPTPRAIHALLQSLFNNGQRTTDNGHFDISTYELSGTYDIRPLVIETILTYLELEGLIASTGPFYNEYKFQPLRPSQQMLARFDPPRQEFLRTILKCARPLKTWFKLDLAQVTKATNSDRARIISALNYLEEQGDLKLEVAGARQGYRRLKDDVDIASLTQTLVTRFADREERDIQRLQSVLDFANTPTCRTQHLLEYFGESLTQDADADARACGHCDHCLGASPTPLPPMTPRPLSESDLQTIQELKSHPHPALATPRQLARFLCGLNSPATTRAKLKTNPAFALLADIPFPQVLQALKQRTTDH